MTPQAVVSLRGQERDPQLEKNVEARRRGALRVPLQDSQVPESHF